MRMVQFKEDFSVEKKKRVAFPSTGKTTLD